MKRSLFIILILNSFIASASLEISLEHNNLREQKAKKILLSFEQEKNLAPFIFTNKIVIKSGSIPHSHPVLTLNTRHIYDPNKFLSVFLHEQMHWFLSKNENLKSINKFITLMKSSYPSIPVGRENGGARNHRSSYLHLAINTLEYEALRTFIGDHEARDILYHSSVYTQLYRIIIQDYFKIKSVMSRLNLLILHNKKRI